MIVNILCAAGIGAFLFLCGYLGFRSGLRMGMQAAKGQPPRKLDPAGAVKNALGVKQPETENQRIMRGYSNMLAFTGNPEPAVPVKEKEKRHG